SANGIRTDDRHPAVGFGELIGNAILSPIGMVVVECDDLLCNGRVDAPRAAGGATGEAGQRSIAADQKAWLPIIEGRAADMGSATGQLDIAGRFPGLKQQLPL